MEERRLVAGVTAGALAVVGAVWLLRRRHVPTTNTSDAAAALAAQRVRHAVELRRKLSGFDTFWMDESGFRVTVRAPPPRPRCLVCRLVVSALPMPQGAHCGGGCVGRVAVCVRGRYAMRHQ
jgi:hypothetical protein